jgi:acyl carrier protein
VDERLKEILQRVFSLTEDELAGELEYEKTRNWSSMGHLMLITEIEAVYEISFTPDEILVMGTVPVIEQMIRKHLEGIDGA